MTTTARRARVPHRTRQLVDELHERALRAALSSLPTEEPREYLYDLLPEYPLRAGKGLRPVLCMAACEVYGGSYDDALPFAAALELLHNAFLVHDDIQDGSPVRRGDAALHERHGVPLALNAGDALAAIATSAFLRAAGRVRPQVATALSEGWEQMIVRTIEGQAMDLGWQRHNRLDVSIAEYLSMSGSKTAWYTTIQPLAIGTLVGSGQVARERETFHFGWLLGLLFQIANDIQGVHAAEGEGEIEEGKRTILVIHLMNTLTGRDRARAVRIMSLPRERRGAAEVDWVRQRMETKGSFDHARACVTELANAAKTEADRLFGHLPRSEARDLLLGITSYILEQHGLADPVRDISPVEVA
jgi:geranylgeranyl diphosphate synthase type II